MEEDLKGYLDWITQAEYLEPLADQNDSIEANRRDYGKKLIVKLQIAKNHIELELNL